MTVVARTAPPPVGLGLPPSPPLPSAVQTAWMSLDPFGLLERMRSQYGSRFTLKALARPPLVFIADPEEARAVFGAPPDVLAPGEGGQTIVPIVGERSFMLADGETHRRGRARLARLYTAEATAHHRELVRELAERELAGWPAGTPIALHPRLRALTLRVILATLIGSDLDERAPSLHTQLLAMLSISEGLLLSLEPARRVPLARARWQRFLDERAAVDATLLRLIEQRRQEGRTGDDGLGVLLAACDEHGQPLTSAYVRDSLMSLILAGHETTSAELAWSFQLIAHDQRVQRTLHDELDSGRDAYLTATIQETLRHRPVFLFAIPRAVRAPIQIGDWTHLPPAHLLVCLYLLHHDPQLFADPHRFTPERFLDTQPDGDAWLPWGGGRKRCLGWRLAFLELQTILATALARYAIEPAHPTLERPRWRSVIVTPHRGCRVILRQRPSPRRS
ncbi:MAG: cytochrome P450 [Conexibacter sp.]